MAVGEAFEAQMIERVGTAYARTDDWAEAIRAAIEAGFELVGERRPQAREFAATVLAGGPAGLEAGCAAIGDAARRLRQGRLLHPAAASLPEGTERTLVAGVVMLAAVHLLGEDRSGLAAVEAEAIEMVLAPYLGVPRARELASASA
jgi:hypothetical protein